MVLYVNVREIWIQTYKVEALSEEEAIQKVRDAKTENTKDVTIVDGAFELSHRLGIDTWTVETE